MGKLGMIVMILLVVGLAFSLVGSIVNDFETQYPEIEVNTSWSSKYDYSYEINESISGLKTSLDKIGDEEAGWFEKVTSGIVAIPQAIILVPSVMFITMRNGIIVISDVATEIGVPPFVIPFAIIAVIIAIIFALLSFWRRYPT